MRVREGHVTCKSRQISLPLVVGWVLLLGLDDELEFVWKVRLSCSTHIVLVLFLYETLSMVSNSAMASSKASFAKLHALFSGKSLSQCERWVEGKYR